MNYREILLISILAFSAALSVLFNDIAKKERPTFTQKTTQYASHTPSNDVFCDIIAGVKPATIFAENDGTVVIASLSGHPLVIPKKHIENLTTVTKSEVLDLAHMLQLATETARTHEKFKDKVYNRAYFHTGSRAAQTVPHLHMHMSFDGKPVSLVPADLTKVAYEDDVATIIIENSTRVRALSKVPLPHLGELDVHSSGVLAHLLFVALQTIKKQFPFSDYVTNIRNARKSDGQETLVVSFTLR